MLITVTGGGYGKHRRKSESSLGNRGRMRKSYTCRAQRRGLTLKLL